MKKSLLAFCAIISLSSSGLHAACSPQEEKPTCFKTYITKQSEGRQTCVATLVTKDKKKTFGIVTKKCLGLSNVIYVTSKPGCNDIAGATADEVNIWEDDKCSKPLKEE